MRCCRYCNSLLPTPLIQIKKSLNIESSGFEMRRRAASLLGTRLQGLVISPTHSVGQSSNQSSTTVALVRGFLTKRPVSKEVSNGRVGEAVDSLVGGSARVGGQTSGRVSQTRAAASQPSAQQMVNTKVEPSVLPLTTVDEVGAISIVEPHEKDYVVREFENVDGRRIEDGRYAAFVDEISGAHEFPSYPPSIVCLLCPI